MINKELKKKINELEPYLTNGRPINGNIIVDTYNQVFEPDPRTGRTQPYTSCGSCLRRMLKEMVNALKKENAERTKKAREAKEKKKEKQGEEKPLIDIEGILTASKYDKLYQNCKLPIEEKSKEDAV